MVFIWSPWFIINVPILSAILLPVLKSYIDTKLPITFPSESEYVSACSTIKSTEPAYPRRSLLICTSGTGLSLKSSGIESEKKFIPNAL